MSGTLIVGWIVSIAVAILLWMTWHLASENQKLREQLDKLNKKEKKI